MNRANEIQDQAVEQALRDHFQRVMPREFPPVNVAESVRINPMHRGGTRGRWAVAVCLAAAVVAFGLILSARPPQNPAGSPAGVSGSEARAGNPMGAKPIQP